MAKQCRKVWGGGLGDAGGVDGFLHGPLDEVLARRVAAAD